MPLRARLNGPITDPSLLPYLVATSECENTLKVVRGEPGLGVSRAGDWRGRFRRATRNRNQAISTEVGKHRKEHPWRPKGAQGGESTADHTRLYHILSVLLLSWSKTGFDR